MVSDFTDTIAAPATIPGTGAITIIRVSGPRSLEICDKVISLSKGSLSEAAGYSVHYGTAHYPDGKMLDQVLVTVFRNPHSYTGEDSVEISCHASKFVAEELLVLLSNEGARSALPGEFTRRSFVNGKMDLAQAEAVADVISSESLASLEVALNQLKGGFSSELKDLRSKLVEITSLLELELDFSEEDVQFVDRCKLISMIDAVSSHVDSLAVSFRYGNALKNGIPVVIVGPANSGKSTLLNSLLGDQRAIVSDIPGTTRDTIEETITIDSIKYRLIDTAGLRNTADQIEKIGIQRSYDKLSKASIVLLILDYSLPLEDLQSSISDIASRIDFENQELFILLNKSDIWASNKNVSQFNTFVSSIVPEAVVLPISAKTDSDLSELKNHLSKSQKAKYSNSGTSIVTNIRHLQALQDTSSALQSAKHAILSDLTPDLIAEDLHNALHHLGSITGETAPDEILGLIFSRFCIGK